MQYASNATGGQYVEDGVRRPTTIDKAMEDGTAGLQRLSDEDLGESFRQIPTVDDVEQIRGLYAGKREELLTHGARLNSTDYYRQPASASSESA